MQTLKISRAAAGLTDEVFKYQRFNLHLEDVEADPVHRGPFGGLDAYRGNGNESVDRVFRVKL